MEARKHISDATGSRADKPYKATLFDGKTLFLGVNTLEPGQVQTPHSHSTQDKFFFVHRGSGHFSVEQQSFEAHAGDVVFMPAGSVHGVENRSKELLVLLMGIAPSQAGHHH
ncbi:MAG: cupin domain-containing protein [Planctomycetes bacterium]|nr:cupin domain-containing protein [Planctomycetota bacterium]